MGLVKSLTFNIYGGKGHGTELPGHVRRFAQITLTIQYNTAGRTTGLAGCEVQGVGLLGKR